MERNIESKVCDKMREALKNIQPTSVEE
jgi:hypothetical protein